MGIVAGKTMRYREVSKGWMRKCCYMRMFTPQFARNAVTAPDTKRTDLGGLVGKKEIMQEFRRSGSTTDGVTQDFPFNCILGTG